MSTALTGQNSIPSGAQVAPGPILSGQQLRVGDTIANTFDPRVTGLQRPVGSVCYTADGTTSYQKTGTAATDWSLSGSANGAAPLTLVLADATTATAPTMFTERHTTSGTAAAGFGRTNAVELENEAGTTRVVETDATSYVVTVDAAETAKRQISLIKAGALTGVGGFGFESNANAALYLGLITAGNLLRTYSGNIDLMLAGAAVQIWAPTVSTFLQKINMLGAALNETQAAVASGSTLPVTAVANYFHVTGTTNIDYIATPGFQAGSRIELYFDGALTLNHNTGSVPGSTNALRLVGAVNAAMAAGSKITLRLDSTLTRWVEVGRSGA